MWVGGGVCMGVCVGGWLGSGCVWVWVCDLSVCTAIGVEVRVYFCLVVCCAS